MSDVDESYVFDTPEPVLVTVDLPHGGVRVVAGDRTDTRVTVSTGSDSPPTSKVVLAEGVLAITGPTRRRFGWALDRLRGSAAEDVLIEAPTGTRIQATLAMGEYRCAGPLGECRLTTRYGDIRVEQAGPLQASTAYGDIRVDRATDDAELTTSAGELHVRTLDAGGVLKNDYGETRVGHVGGDLQVTGLYGDIRVDRAEAGVTARTAYGGVRVDDVARGVVDLVTTSGVLEVGIRAGTAAWLDVSSASGRIRNSLDPRDNPDGFTDTVEVHARTAGGDIVVRRA
ncbi:DUF4097 domain-containing protein [Pseudonocardia benzenivorans]|uniref:DUF4097 domain-containing protein n=1 Tax=Pseudonocardia benzenivorans TaxID=228005 RepID=A0ABW3VHG2_9PSEU